eukprot:gnl/TRDRNA2_/TRDRNA2_57560_c0_seq1.p1 gnl/TRDRNA2_/TRDRNA2_57560_c0~~gnl/TRDRNA2_/TRDRNA2_57560_c0_seq1.p1  ORF type:complete len:407 (+),score=77.46 gnl/TRDRNA2_/TRDRNA2_57560_c0_seq1:29-1222(+)
MRPLRPGHTDCACPLLSCDGSGSYATVRTPATPSPPAAKPAAAAGGALLPAVAVEILTAAEAEWHVVVLAVFATGYLLCAVAFCCCAVLNFVVIMAVSAAGLVAVGAPMAALVGFKADAIRGLLRASSAAAVQGSTDAGGATAALPDSKQVGMTEEEVAFVEAMLSVGMPPAPEVVPAAPCGHELREVVVLRPQQGAFGCEAPAYSRECSRPAAVPGYGFVVTSELAQAKAPRQLPARASGSEPSREVMLQALHDATAACDVAQLAQAIGNAKAAGICSDEIAFADAVLEIEKARQLQNARRRLRRVMAEGDMGELRLAIQRARYAGADPREISIAEEALKAATAMAQSGSGSTSRGRKRVTFADEVFGYHEVEPHPRSPEPRGGPVAIECGEEEHD